MRAHIEKKKLKRGHVWRIIIETGKEADGRRTRIYRCIRGAREDAEALMARLVNELATGSYIAPERITVAEFLDEYYRTQLVPNLSPTSLDGYGDNIRLYIVPHIGRVPLQELKPLHLQRMYQDLLENGKVSREGGLSPASIRYVHVVLRKALNHALRMQMVRTNVADMVTLPKRRSPPRADVYNEAELQRLLEASRGTEMEAAVALAVVLGLRRGEALALRWEDVDFEAGHVTVSRNLVSTSKGPVLKEPKSEKGKRTLTLPEGIISIFKGQKARQAEQRLRRGPAYRNNGLVVCKEDGSPFDPSTFNHYFRRFLTRHGLRLIRYHDLRHSHATLLLKYKIHPKVASQRLGHSTIAITLDLYSHVLIDMQKEVADKLDDGLFGGVNGGRATG